MQNKIQNQPKKKKVAIEHSSPITSLEIESNETEKVCKSGECTLSPSSRLLVSDESPSFANSKSRCTNSVLISIPPPTPT